MSTSTRRDAIKGIVVGSAGLALSSLTASDSDGGTPVLPNAVQLARAFRGEHQPKPVPFDPAKLKGISEKLIRSHHENNYCGAVKALNAVEQRLDAMMKQGLACLRLR